MSTIRFVPELVGLWDSPTKVVICPECGGINTTGVSEPGYVVAVQCFSCGARFVPDFESRVLSMQGGIRQDYINRPGDCTGLVHCPNCGGERTNFIMVQTAEDTDIVCQCYDCGFRCPQEVAFDRDKD